MAEPHSVPSKISASGEAVSLKGKILITAFLKGGDIYIDGDGPFTIDGPLSLKSPISCSTFFAQPAQVVYSIRGGPEASSTVYKYYNEPFSSHGFQCSTYDKSDYTKIEGSGTSGTTIKGVYDAPNWNLGEQDPHLIHTAVADSIIRISLDAQKWTDGIDAPMKSDLHINDQREALIEVDWGSGVGQNCKMMVAQQGKEALVHEARVQKGDVVKLYAHGNPPASDNVWVGAFMFQSILTEWSN